MYWPYHHYVQAQETASFFRIDKLSAIIVNNRTLECPHMSIVNRFYTTWFSNMNAIVIVYDISENLNSVWKRTTTGYGKVVMAMSFVSFCMALAFLLLHIVAIASIVAFFATCVCHLLKRAESMSGFYKRLLLRVLGRPSHGIPSRIYDWSSSSLSCAIDIYIL